MTDLSAPDQGNELGATTQLPLRFASSDPRITAQPPQRLRALRQETRLRRQATSVRPLKSLPMNRTDLVRGVQEQLTRLACDTNGVDGKWGPNSRRALDAYVAASGNAYREPSLALLRVLQGTNRQVCATSCNAGFRLRNGACVKAQVVVEPTDFGTGTRPRTNCFVFGGVQRCGN